MLNNSWKKYGGIRNTDQFHNLNIGTLVADQVLLREKVTTETIFNTLLIANGGSITTSLIATTNIDICNNLIVYNDIDSKSKLLFSSNNTNNVYFFKHLNTNFLGLNNEAAAATLHIVAGDNAATNVFRATSLNSSVRSVLAENSGKKGISVNSDTTTSNIKFFNANTVEGAADTTLTSTNAGLFTLSSASHILSANGGSSFINSTTTMDLSSNTIMTLRAGTGMRMLSNNTLDLSSNSTMKINSNTLLNIVSPITNIYSNLHLSNRNTVSNIYNETLVIYDNSYGNYLYDAYENSSAKTGNALTVVADTNTSNTFMNIVTPSKLGLMVGGGSYINDNARSMGTIGVTNSTGNYLPTQTIISSNSKAKYYTTTGFNTYSPRSEQYLMDINGATRITNGEINKVLDISYEIINMSFSKYNSKYGIASGTPSSFTFQFNQTLNYTTDGGLNWTAVRFDSASSSIEGSSKNITISVYDGTYSIIGANNGFSYYTNNGGANWYKFSLPSGQRNIQKVFIQQTNNSSKRIMLAYNTSTAATIPTTTDFIGYFDITLASLPNNGYTVSTLNTFIPSITTINYMDGYNDVVYLVGAGIQKYQVSTLASQYNIKNSNTYHYIHVYDTNYAVAVGVNILSYTRDGTNWTDVALSSTTLNSVYVYNSQYAVAVGTNGKIYYTKDTNYATWSIVPNALLHSGGNAGRINGSTNVLRNVHMPDINTLLISNIKQSYVLASAYGLSKVYNCYFPNLFNRSQNSVLDLSGAMNVGGDINIVEGGNLYVNNTTTLNGNVLVNMDILVLGNINTLKNVVSTGDTAMNGRLSVINDVSMNSLLVVGSDITTNKRLFAVGDSYLNGNLFVSYDTSLNSRLVVGSDITTNKRLFTIGDTSHNGNLFVAYDTSLNSRLVVGSDITTNKRLFAIGDTSLNGNLFVVYDTSLNSRLVVGSDITTNKRLFAVGDSYLNGNLFVDKNTTLNGNVLINMEVSIIGNIFLSKNITSNGDTQFNKRLFIVGDSSLNGNLFVAYDTSLNSRLVVGSDITTNKRLFAVGDASLNSNLFVAKDISCNGNMYIGKDITIMGRLNIQNYTNQNIINTTMTNYQLIISEDISLNGRLCISSDASMNKNLFVAYDTSLNSRLVVGSDITTNKRLFTVGDTSLNGNLFVSYDTSLNSRLVVGSDITTNKRLFTIGDTSLNGKLFIASDTSLNGNFSLNGSFRSLRDISVNTITIGLGGGSLATCTAVGYQVLKSKISGNNNTAFGYNALTSNTTGELNTAIGSGAMGIGTTAANCVAVGYNALSNSTGLYNVAVGNGALELTTTGDNNVAIGYEAAKTQTNVVGTVSIGSQSSKVSRVQTTAVGYYALFSNTDGIYNTSIGGETLLNNTTGSYNTSLGYQSLRGSTYSSNHTAIGYQALASNNTGANNTAVGYQAGYAGTANTAGSNNTLIGYQAQLSSGPWSNSTALGSGATITTSNQVVLGTASEKIYIPGKIGVGTASPSTALHVNGTTTSTNFNATSDYRIKTNVVSLEDTPITIDNLRPVMYTNLLSNKEDIGFIAHEVQEHIPFLVSGEKDGEHHQSINYNGMIGILTKEIQELKKENRNLQERLALLESKLL